MMVVHVKVGFRKGLPEINSRNKLLGAVKASSKHQSLFEGTSGSFHSKLAPIEGDVVVTKSRVNAFAGTDLELLLRTRDIDTLVMFGIATSGVVLSTALHAADNDYRLFILKDCCADLDATVHDCLVEKVLPNCATVLSAEEMLRLIDLGTASHVEPQTK
jgi:nicotinamidase-related amidase